MLDSQTGHKMTEFIVDSVSLRVLCVFAELQLVGNVSPDISVYQVD